MSKVKYSLSCSFNFGNRHLQKKKKMSGSLAVSCATYWLLLLFIYYAGKVVGLVGALLIHEEVCLQK